MLDHTVRKPRYARYVRLGLLVLLVALVAGAGWLVNTRQSGPRPATSSGNTGEQPLAAQPVQDAAAQPQPATQAENGVQVGHSYKNDVSPPLRDIPPVRSALERKDP